MTANFSHATNWEAGVIQKNERPNCAIEMQTPILHGTLKYLYIRGDQGNHFFSNKKNVGNVWKWLLWKKQTGRSSSPDGKCKLLKPKLKLELSLKYVVVSESLRAPQWPFRVLNKSINYSLG